MAAKKRHVRANKDIWDAIDKKMVVYGTLFFLNQ